MIQRIILLWTLFITSHSFQINHQRKCNLRKLQFGPDHFGITSHQSSSSPTSKSPSAQQYDPVKQKNLVWIIDDEQSILDAVGAYLTSSGYQVQAFLNATSPLSLLQKEEGQPDAIISDVMMPQISGIDFLSMIRSNPSPSIHNMPFILLTAKGMTEDRIKGYDAGTDGYLMKPFDPEELVVILDQMIQRKEFIQADQSISIEELRTDLFEVKGLIEEKKMLVESANIVVGQESNSILSEIEMKILELLCEGYMNKEIASELQYSTSRVEKYLTTMFRKAGCNNRTELVRWAVANEYVDL
jgi:DNA-binding NarL/FixJ family response regulator